ncbi:MAG: transglycosylase SLT domain-containing protein [Candidatus Baltobacteraceae bacterium]
MTEQRYGLPRGFLGRLADVESSRNPGTPNSRTGAVGLFQLMPGTAHDLGVNPQDPVQSADGAARMIVNLWRRFGSLPAAVAAYHDGPGAFAKEGWAGLSPEGRAEVAKVVGES